MSNQLFKNIKSINNANQGNQVDRFWDDRLHGKSDNVLKCLTRCVSHHNCFSEGTKWTMIEKKKKKNCSSTFGDFSYRNLKKFSLQFILWCPHNLFTLKWQWCPEEIIDGMKLFNSKLGIVNFEYIKLRKLISAQHCSKTVKFQWTPEIWK